MGDGPADIVFHGGDIFTLDDKNPQVEALAVKGEVILAIGNYADMHRVQNSERPHQSYRSERKDSPARFYRSSSACSTRGCAQVPVYRYRCIRL